MSDQSPADSLALRLLKQRGKAAPAHPVRVHIQGKNAQGLDVEDHVEAVLVYVSDAALHAAQDAAAAALAGKSPTIDRRASEEAYHILCEALRAPDNRAERLFTNVTQAKAMLVGAEAVRLSNEYGRFIQVHYPDTLSKQEMAAIEEAARSHFLPDLLTRFGTLPILRALPSLAATYGAPLIVSSSPTE